jgi:hypothetical protein
MGTKGWIEMAESVLELLTRSYARTQRRLLEVVVDLSEEQFHRSVAPSFPQRRLAPLAR